MKPKALYLNSKQIKKLLIEGSCEIQGIKIYTIDKKGKTCIIKKMLPQLMGLKTISENIESLYIPKYSMPTKVTLIKNMKPRTIKK